MSRLIFSKPIEIDREARLFQSLINEHNGKLTERVLAVELTDLFNKVTPRDIRKIAERYNKRKYLNCDNTTKYHKTKGRYYKVIKDSERANLILNKIKFDMISTATTYKIYLEDFGKFEDDKNSMQIDMLDKLLNNMNINELLDEVE